MITREINIISGEVSVITQTETGNHRVPLNPGDFARAHELLPDDMYAELESFWTPEVIEAWREANAEPEPGPGSPAPEGYISDSEALRIIFGGGIND